MTITTADSYNWSNNHNHRTPSTDWEHPDMALLEEYFQGLDYRPSSVTWEVPYLIIFACFVVFFSLLFLCPFSSILGSVCGLRSAVCCLRFVPLGFALLWYILFFNLVLFFLFCSPLFFFGFFLLFCCFSLTACAIGRPIWAGPVLRTCFFLSFCVL